MFTLVLELENQVENKQKEHSKLQQKTSQS